MKRALIADDHLENLYFLEILLKGHGFEIVDSAENGVRALELARTCRPDLIISDILMPAMDGYAFCKSLKGDPDFRDIPFIFYTATFTTPRDEELALSLGADRFVIKPQEPDALMQIINQVLAGPRPEFEPQTPESEQQVMEEYSQALFRKLEKKTADLEIANRALEEKCRELLKAYEAAECASQAKIRFLHVVSHELRTPLNVILGSLQLSELNKAYDPDMTRLAKSALFSMLEMIDNILEASRIDSGQENSGKELLCPEKLLDSVSRLFSAAAHEKGIDLCFSLDDDVPVQMVVDGAYIQQILVHLLNNAIKFTEKGSIELRFKIESGMLDEGRRLKIEVQDTGIGIDLQKQQIVFDLFTLGDDSDTRSYGGIGLGLALTRRLVELMGGEISMKSVPGAGSTFIVSIPFTLVV